MNGVREGTEGIAKFLDVLRNLPLWLFAGLAIGTGVILGVPQIALVLPASLHPSVVITCVLSGALAIAQATALTVGWVHRWRASRIARKTFHLTANAMQSHWSASRQADDSIVTQVAVRMLAKNLTDLPVALTGCRLIWPRIRGEVVHEDVSVRAVDRNIYGTAAESGHFIPGHMSLPASAHIMIRGVPWPKPKKVVHVTVGVKDDEGNEQKIKLRMRVMPSVESIAKPRPLELVSDIADPVERQVAAVLQAELPRYEKIGRRVGGLGSIHLVVGGKPLPAATADSWNPDSPKPQSIAENPEAAALGSDNLEALLAVYSGLASDDERQRFAAALLDRLDAEKGYLSVSYFIVCVLWKIGKLSEALASAKANLPQGEIKVFGLSNVLMLLNMLLRYRYPDFDDEALDQIERFLRGLNEHPFQIPEKIAAIRAMRLRERATSQSSGVVSAS
jgi:hypothetical protein